MSNALFEELFQDQWAQSDANLKVSIDMVIDGETISVTLEDLASVLQPPLKTTLAPLAKYRRVPRTVVPKVELLSPMRYLHSHQMKPLRELLRLLCKEPQREVMALVEKLPQARMENLAKALFLYSSESSSLSAMMDVALESEFIKAKSEKGSIMRGSSFAVQMAKQFVMGPQFTAYRRAVLDDALSQVAAAAAAAAPNAELDLNSTIRLILVAITSDQAVSTMPPELRHVCYALSQLSDKNGLVPEERDSQVAGLIMLRFFNPAIISPWTHDLLQNVQPSSVLSHHLKDVTRVLQKFSTGLSLAEDGMSSTQAVLNELYPAFREYLQKIGSPISVVSNDFSVEPSEESCLLLFDAVYGVGDYIKQKNWTEVLMLVQDLKYVCKLQLFLQSEASYLASLEKIEESLRKISASTISTGDPFEVMYNALREISSWHLSLFLMLHDRLETEWHLENTAADWMHLILLEFDAVYEPFLSSFLFCFRTLIDISRDLSSSEGGENAETVESITRLLPMIGHPLKRLSEILAIVSDSQLPLGHRDEQHVRAFLARGKELFILMKEAVNVSSVLEMGHLQLHFVEKLDLIRPGRVVVRQGYLSDTQGQQLELWLFNDLILCGVPVPGTQNFKLLFKSPIGSITTKPVQGDELSFSLSVLADPVDEKPGSTIRSRRMSVQKPLNSDFRLKCPSAKQKGAWLTDILGLQEKLMSEDRLSRSSAARQQLPNMGSTEWQQIMKGGSKTSHEDGEVLLEAKGPHGGRLYRVVEGRCIIRLGATELSKLGPGDVFCLEALTCPNCLFEVVVSGGAAVVESSAPNLDAALQSADPALLRRLYKSLTTLAESALRKVRLRYAASRVLQSKQKKGLSPAEIGDLIIKALDEVETCATNSSYSKLDVADLLLGAEPVEFTTPLITDVFTRLLEMKCYRAGLGHLTRSQWVAVITALENEKHVVVKDGCPTLTKKGKGLNGSAVAKAIQDALESSEDFFGLKNESALAQFQITAKNADRLVVSQHYLCFSGRVLGLGAEKKQLIHMGHVVGIELNKKNLEIVHGNPQQSIKVSFKCTNEANTVFSLLQRRELRGPHNKIFDSFPSATFPPGSVISSSERSAVYALQDISTVKVVAKMAAGDLVLYNLHPGSVFVTDPAFFGLPDDSKVTYVADENSAVTVREVSVEALGESEALCVSVLKELFKVQMAEAQHYVQMIK